MLERKQAHDDLWLGMFGKEEFFRLETFNGYFLKGCDTYCRFETLEAAQSFAETSFEAWCESAGLVPLRDGWKMVPEEPTDDMYRAAYTAIDNTSLHNFRACASPKDIYCAMLAAAPSPEDA